MKYTETRVKGVVILEFEPITDERGFFARAWDEQEGATRNMPLKSLQCNTSLSLRQGTVRGMHYQEKPHAEAKLVRCTRGAVYDVALDVRRDSPTYRTWVAVELTPDNYRMLYIPEGCAHGFQTLADTTEVFYQMSEYFHPESARGVRFDDPAFAIEWPEAQARTMSDKDRSYPDWVV